MFPVICQIGPLTIFSYGLMLAVAVIVCSFLLSRDAKKEGIPPSFIFDLVFWVVIGGIIGARLFFIGLHITFFIEHPLEMIMIQNGGLAWQGGLLGGALAGITFVRSKSVGIVMMLDLAAPYLALGQSIGRIGCFLNGCCFGTPVAWGIYFPVHGLHLHPTQLYSTAGLFVIFIALKQFQKKSKTGGEVFVLYLFLAAGLRFVIEFFRADHIELVLGLSVFQWVCLAIILTAVFLRRQLHLNAKR